MEKHDKLIDRRMFGRWHTLRRTLVNNWCLKRSKFIYALASRVCPGEVRINVAMRCRDDAAADWGHAWVTYNGRPLWEHDKVRLAKEKTKIAETGKYIYWIYN